MVSRYLSDLPAVRSQNLRVEFSALNTACPYGIFMALTPGNASLWSGVMFIRKGPYTGAILRFQISFPPSYPSTPPVVIFSTEMFHPLIKPLTTYVYTTGTEESGTVSSADEERLPPGGFSLRHGFSEWFGNKTRTKYDAENKRQINSTRQSSASSILTYNASSAPTHIDNARGSKEHENVKTNIYQVLRYIRSTFDNEAVLDQVPLVTAGNPGAWHAWRTHRTKTLKNSLKRVSSSLEDSKSIINVGSVEDQAGNISSIREYSDVPRKLISPKISTSTEWDWDGVWKIRVKKCVDASKSESVLFGKDSGDDLIRFLHMENTQINALKDNIKQTFETVEPARRSII